MLRIAGASLETQRALVEEYCAKCHNDQLKSGGFSWTDLDIAHPEANAKQAEKVIRKLRAGMMPPSGQARPKNAAVDTFVRAFETRIDEAAAAVTAKRRP